MVETAEKPATARVASPGAANLQTASGAEGATGDLGDLLDYVFTERRVCPMPSAWQALHAILMDHRGGDAVAPPAPLLFTEWWETTDLDKARRLRLQLEYAASHGDLPAAQRLLRELPTGEWYRGTVRMY